MGLLSILIAVVLIVLLIIFAKVPLSSFNTTPNDAKKIENSAQDAVNSTIENSKFQQNQLQEIEK